MLDAGCQMLVKVLASDIRHLTSPPLFFLEDYSMSRIVRCGLIQATNAEPAESSIEKIKRAMVDKHVAMIADAAKQGVQIICLQELFYGPYFCAEQNPHWYGLVERIPDGPTTQLMCEIAKQ